jgi:hypothetical protein
MISNQEKINLINEKLEGINVNILWLNTNIGLLEDIPSEGKPSMQEQLNNLISKKNALLEVLDQLQ